MNMNVSTSLHSQNSQSSNTFPERWVRVLHGSAEQLLRGRNQVARHWLPPREADHLWRRGGTSSVCETDLPKYSHPLRGIEITNLVSVVIYLLFYLWRCWLSNSVKPIKWDQSRSMTKANKHFQNFDQSRFVQIQTCIQITKLQYVQKKGLICTASFLESNDYVSLLFMASYASYQNAKQGCCWEVSSIEDQWKMTSIGDEDGHQINRHTEKKKKHSYAF